jgi:hypothetical protein
MTTTATATSRITSFSSSSSSSSRRVRLEFTDFVDLQTRLVLLPRIEEEGRGAVVASFLLADHQGSPVRPTTTTTTTTRRPEKADPSETTGVLTKQQNSCSSSSSDGGSGGEPSEQAVAEPSKEHRDDEEATPSEDGKSTTSTTTNNNHFTEPTSTVTKDDDNDDNDSEEEVEDHPETQVVDVTGCILVGIQGPVECSAEEWKEMDFTSILASIRQETAPIVLLLESPLVSINNSDDDSRNLSSPLDDSATFSSTTTTTNPRRTSDEPQSPAPVLSATTTTTNSSPNSSSISAAPAADSWSAWGMRMRANTEKLAAEAASNLSTAVAVAAAEAKERARLASLAQQQKLRQQQQQRDEEERQQQHQELNCNVYLQSSSGAYFPVASSSSSTTTTGAAAAAISSSSRSSTERKVTTSSLLVVRQSATEPCTPKGFSFQWYRSFAPSSPLSQDDASLSSNSADSSASHGGSSSSCSSSRDGGGGRNHHHHHHQGVLHRSGETGTPMAAPTEWELLPGATYAAFQPNATLVGRRLRCIIRVETDDSSLEGEEDDLHDDDEVVDTTEDDDELDNTDLDSVHHLDSHKRIICDLPDPVCADLALFNGSRQALGRGAKFGGLVGHGNAQGRTFRLEVALAMCQQRRNKVFGSLAIYQSQGTESILLTEKPILQVTAKADPSHPKRFELILPATSDTMNSMLEALCTDGTFQLEAPNRVTRESFLLSLGIANYRGKPANLMPTTILYRDEPMTARSLSDDCSASSAGSMVSTSLSIRSSVKVSTTSPNHSCPTSPQQQQQHGTELFQPPISTVAERTPGDRIALMEEELRFLRSKLAKKDKVVSELQRQVTQSDAAHEVTRLSQVAAQKESQRYAKETDELKFAMSAASKKLEANEAKLVRLKGEHNLHSSTLEHRIMSQSEKIADLEKANRTLQNEKAVLSAAVEARESKLVRMGELRNSFDKLSKKVAQHDALRIELQETNKRYEEIREDLEQVSQFEKQCREELEQARKTVDQLSSRLQEHDQKTLDGQSQQADMLRKIQVLKSERNSYKQKGDSLSKEMSKLCRNGRTTKDIEKILADFDALRDEVEELRKQKRKALEDVHMYRTSYEQTRVAAEQLTSAAGSKAVHTYETRKALERNAELERLLEEMTEYVNAKEMQLGTFKQVNEALQEEIHKMAKASLCKNEV